MKKNALRVLLAVILVVCCIGVVGCDVSQQPIANYASDTVDTTVNTSTQLSDLQTQPEGLSETALNTLTVTTSAYYYLSQDWTGTSALSKSLTINAGAGNIVYLDLRGNSISVASGLSVIKVTSGTLVLFDSIGGGTITGASQKDYLGGGGVYVAAGATLELYDGVSITDNETQTSTYLGGGVYNAGTFYMYGGTISNNTSAGIGGGVYNSTSGVFYMQGGTISGNQAGSGNYGAGVYNAGTFNMSGGTISGNTSSAGGGGVSNVGTMIMSGGSIVDNTATGSGAGIFTAGGATLTITGGTFSGNTTSANGGAIAVMGDNANASISGCEITNNTASGNGGGIVVSGTNATVDMYDCTITNNSASGNGGGVYFGNGQLTMSGGITITDNGTSSSDANNVYVADDQEIVVTADVTGTVGVTYASNEGAIVVAKGYTINEATATSFLSDNTDYYPVLAQDGSQIELAGEAVIDVVDDDTVITGGVASYTYGDTIDVSTLFDIGNLNNITYTVTATSGSATLSGAELEVELVGTFVVTASSEATVYSAAASGQVTVTVAPLDVYISGIEALMRGVNENNLYVDLNDETGVIKDGNGNTITDIIIDYSSAYGVIDDEEYYNDETLNSDTAYNTFDVTVHNVKLAGTYSDNYNLVSVADDTTVYIYTGFPLVYWPTVSDITYGEVLTNDSLVGGKVVLKVGEDYITVSGSFVWVTEPSLKDVGSYSNRVQFVVDTTATNYSTIEEYVSTIEYLTHYVSYSVNQAAVTFDISNNVLEAGSTSTPTITATTAYGTVDPADYTILYFQIDGGVVYYSFTGSATGDGSASNPYLLDTTTAGTYLIGAELSDNYHHSGTVENSAKQIGVLYIVDNASDVTSYTVTFQDEDGNTISTITSSYSGSIIVMPTNDNGIGWVNAKGVFYEFGDRYAQPAYDEKFTLVTATTVTICGYINGTDLNGIKNYPLEGITVQLMSGSDIVATTATDDTGAYFLADIPEGTYTLVVIRSMSGLTNVYSVMVVTEAYKEVTVVDTITLPDSRSNVVLDVDAGFTGITVDGLDSIAQEDNTITIYVDSVETNGTEQTAILEYAQQYGLTNSNVKLYFDIHFTELSDDTEVALSELSEDVTFNIPLAGIYQNKSSYTVYVYYNGSVVELIENTDYTCDGTTLTITTKYAGVYALAFVDQPTTLEVADQEAIYSADAIDLSTVFGTDTTATYTISSSTGAGTISGYMLTVTKVGEFVITITTAETATSYSSVGTATLTVTPAIITVGDIVAIDRGLIEDNVVVDLDTSTATISGIVEGDSVTISFSNAYGVIVDSEGSVVYYYEYDNDVSNWESNEHQFYVLLVGVVLGGSDSANYVLANNYTTVDITTNAYVSWPSSTSILYGQDLTGATLYGGVVVQYNTTTNQYVEYADSSVSFQWANTTTYTDNFGNELAISSLSVGTYLQEVYVYLNGVQLEGYSYYVSFEIVADSVKFEISDNIIQVGGTGTPTITATTGSGETISQSSYEIVYFIVDGGVVYYSFSGSETGDGSYANPYKITTDAEATYLIGALFNLSDDGVYNYHHSGSQDSTAKQIGTLYITNSTLDTYTVAFTVNGEADETLTQTANSGDILVLPTLEGSDYIGWSYNGVTYSFGARFTQPTSNVEFTAVAAPETYTVSGTVTGLPLGATSGDPTGISGVGVALYQGSTLVATTSTNSSGEYSFDDVAVGSYSIVFTRTQGIENVITQYISVVDEDITGVDVEIPNIVQNTVVSVDTGVESVTVDGLDNLHTDDEENTFTVTVSDGSSQVVVLDEIQATALDDGITNDDMKVYLDISISDNSGNIVELTSNLTFYITLAGAYQGYDNYYVYRYHTADDGTVTVEKITTETNIYGEYLSISADGSTLILSICRFSVMGIAFQDNAAEVTINGTTTYYTSLAEAVDFANNYNTDYRIL